MGFSFVNNEFAETKQGHNQGMGAQQEAGGSCLGIVAQGATEGAPEGTHIEEATAQGFDFHEAFNSL
ncbi:hypothetical protein PanWU01x14_039030, partial [Parasponia andersonii]